MDKELIDYLSGFVTENRKDLFNEIIKYRTRYITVVLEDIYQPHNASAVLRTCDCFGIQDIHVIENKNTYSVNPDVALGSNKWINIIKYNNKENNTLEAIYNLKKRGYRIVATTPHTNDIALGDFDLLKGKTALLFGTELQGLSEVALDMSDEYIKIPMFGFTESFNISVSAALILHTLSNKLRNNAAVDWQLSDKDRDEVMLEWYKNSIKGSEGIIKTFYNNNI